MSSMARLESPAVAPIDILLLTISDRRSELTDKLVKLLCDRVRQAGQLSPSSTAVTAAVIWHSSFRAWRNR